MINTSIASRSTRLLQKIAKTKLKPYVWVFDWWESFLESILDLDSAALALDTISSIVRASLEGLASTGGWTPLPFVFSFGWETLTSSFFSFWTPVGCWVLRGWLGGGMRRKSSWILSDILWIVYFVCSLQIRVSRDFCPIKGFVVRFSAIVPTDYRYLRG